MTMERKLAPIGTALLLLLTAVYANHFHNDFAFDDAHTIQDNAYIRDLKNIPRFFVDATTHSSTPANQSYRPLLSTTFAIDYWLAGNKLDPFYFHLDSFAWYLGQQILVFIFFLHVFDQARPHRWNKAAALIGTAFYAFHTANAETINYIYARSDGLSTFWALATVVAYFKFPKTNRYGVGLFWVPLLIALFAKQSSLVVPGLIFLHAAFFEAAPAGKAFSLPKSFAAGLKASAASLALCIAFYAFQSWMTPATYNPGGASRFAYLITQPYVVLHYVENFVLPVALSADTDLQTFQTVTDTRCLLGFAFVASMLIVAALASRKREHRPVAFGILWFFVVLLPTSSIIPWAEVTNDHRTFFPYIGLTMAAVWALALLLYRLDEQGRLRPGESSAVVVLAGMVIAMHAAGVHARNDVWHNGETLWSDVVQKSPGNGRAWMNYGVSLMARGAMPEAEQAFAKALELTPNYSYAHVNMAIVQAARRDDQEAEQHFKTVLILAPENPNGYYFYARFLNERQRKPEAAVLLEKALTISPALITARDLLMPIYDELGEREKLDTVSRETLQFAPDDPVAARYAKGR